MKINKKILIAIMLAGLSTATLAEEKEIKVMVEDVNGIINKTVTVNGKELSDEEITAMEANGDLEVLHLDSSHGKKVMFIKSEDSDGGLHENIEILLNADANNVTKKVVMNGKELTDEEISALELQGKLKTLHVDTIGSGAMHKVMFIDTNNNVSADGVTEMVVQTQFVQADDDNATLGFMANIADDGWHVISVIESSGAEESGLKAGDVIKFMGDQDLSQGKKELSETLNLVSYNEGDMVDLEVLRGSQLVYMSIEARKNNAFDMVMDVKSEDFLWNNQSQIGFLNGEKKVSLGFLTMQHKDGLHVGYMYENSGAQASGLEENDIIKRIGDIDFSNIKGQIKKDLSALPEYDDGEIVEIEVERNGIPMQFSIEAKELSVPNMPHMQNPQKFFGWLERVKDYSNNKDGQIKVMVLDGSDVGKSINFDNVDVDLPNMVGNMNIFITDGDSTSKLLGKDHEMSVLTDGLGKYFGTKGGVLMMNVSQDNIFGLEDGDVIKSIAGINVKTPKDVIKQLIKAEKQEDIKLKIVRHKRNKTLKYNK